MKLLTAQIVRFILVGMANTFVTYLIYLTLLKVFNVDYQVCYLIAFMLGIVISYFLNASVVFSVKVLCLRKILLYPLVYLAQYVLGAVFLNLFVMHFNFSKALSGIAISVVTVPITFILSRVILLGNVKYQKD